MIDRQGKPLGEQTAQGFSLGSRIGTHIPPGQFVRYLAVGVFNTLFGYCTYIFFFTLFSDVISARHPSLLAPLAAVISTPLNITIAYFGYKFFVFKTRGNYLTEWLKCFGVYGVGMLAGLIMLSALTRLLQVFLVRHQVGLSHAIILVDSYLSGRPQAFIAHTTTIPVLAGYIAGALVQSFTAIASFVGHKKITFAVKPPQQELLH